MSDYTIDELQQMLADKIEEELSVENLTTEHVNIVSLASDLENEKVMSGSIIVGNICKSRSNDKQFVEQRHYITEIENNSIVGWAVSTRTYITGSYSDTLTRPTIQIIGTRPKDRTVIKG